MLVGIVSGVDGIAAAQSCPEGNGARGGNVVKCPGPPAALTDPAESIITAQADATTTTKAGRDSVRPRRLRRRNLNAPNQTVARSKGDAVGELAGPAGFRQSDQRSWQPRQCFRAIGRGTLQSKQAVAFAKRPYDAKKNAHAFG